VGSEKAHPLIPLIPLIPLVRFATKREVLKNLQLSCWRTILLKVDCEIAFAMLPMPSLLVVEKGVRNGASLKFAYFRRTRGTEGEKMNEPKRKNGRVALVTGGNKGIGYEVVRGLAENGFTVFLSARD
jgi:hypothetical protein